MEQAGVRIECNVCGGTEFVDQASRRGVRCAACGSLERTRALQLVLAQSNALKPGARVMHLAPEHGIAINIKRSVGDGYEAYDLFPDNFRGVKVRRMDLVTDTPDLPSNHYDLIVHMHVLEHLPCDVTSVLFHLHRALRPGGLHVFGVPILGGRYEACFGDLPAEERVRRFGQNDHVRRFAAADLAVTLGMVFRMPEKYDLEDQFPRELLERYNIPPNARKGFTSNTVFAMGKDDIRLRA